MVNNFEQIRGLLEFEKGYCYFIQILQRKKDHKSGMKVNGANNNSRTIKNYYVTSLEQFDFIQPEITQLCEVFNARAGINLNKRNGEQMALAHIKKCIDQVMNKEYFKAHKAYATVLGAAAPTGDKHWIIDIDESDLDRSIRDSIAAFINTLQPRDVENKVIAEIPSKSGWHLITSPFNKQKFKEMFQTIDIHTNNPTNLYIP